MYNIKNKINVNFDLFKKEFPILYSSARFIFSGVQETTMVLNEEKYAMQIGMTFRSHYEFREWGKVFSALMDEVFRRYVFAEDSGDHEQTNVSPFVSMKRDVDFNGYAFILSPFIEIKEQKDA